MVAHTTGKILLLLLVLVDYVHTYIHTCSVWNTVQALAFHAILVQITIIHHAVVVTQQRACDNHRPISAAPRTRCEHCLSPPLEPSCFCPHKASSGGSQRSPSGSDEEVPPNLCSQCCCWVGWLVGRCRLRLVREVKRPLWNMFGLLRFRKWCLPLCVNFAKEERKELGQSVVYGKYEYYEGYRILNK